MPMELPARGTVRGSGTCCLMKSRVAAPASSSVTVELSMAASRPLLVCILRTRSSIPPRTAGGRALIPTGIAIALPEGYAGLVLPRSGLAMRHGVTCLNTPGLIDCGYRDELKVLLVNTDTREDYRVERGDRIAQLVIQRVE